MHTSTQLAADDFTYWQVTDNARCQLPFGKFCPNYHELDRSGVVSLSIDDGILHAGRTLLALTTAFYDCHRARTAARSDGKNNGASRGDFFDYPQHFAFVDTHDAGAQPVAPERWGAWSELDVWPANKWIAATPTATGMLARVFDHQINRLFWPHHLRPALGEEPLPDYVYQMLRTHLKAVYYYGPAGDPTGRVIEKSANILNEPLPMLEVHGSPIVDELLQKSIARLPDSVRQEGHCIAPEVERLFPVSVNDFMASMEIECKEPTS